jgi:lipid-A-disaccharide synthase
MIIAGEASGDLHGAQLVKAMVRLDPELEFFGVGGHALRRAGVDVRIDNAQMAVVGVSEALSKLNLLLRALRRVKEDLKEIRPALLILIDFPDFNLRVAAAAKKIGVPVMYYISPQVWAWRTRRVKKIKKLVDHMVVIFPFEVGFYRKWNVPVTFVGHPLLDSVLPKDPEQKCEGLEGQGMLIGLLPGSRNEEVARLLPTMAEVAEMLSEKIDGVRFAVPVASSVNRHTVESIVHGRRAKFLVVSDRVQDVLDEATLVITASGTVTLEVAMAGTPMIVVYKVSPLSYWLGKRLIRVKHIGLANLVAERPIVPELIQHEASAERIVDEALRMIRDEKRLRQMRQELLQTAKTLGDPGASKRAAKVALSLLSDN